MPIETTKWLETSALIPVLRASSVKEALALADAMVAGGVTVIEVTMTIPEAMTVLAELKSRYGARLLLGAGTVLTVEQCVESVRVGGEFIVSPSLKLDVIRETKELGKVSIPGGMQERTTSRYFPVPPSVGQAT
jgi:2-dehydro-3-deoxyphosphogluconate aldolase/(4S)-4-hydroxy-2-oxoglutarate aldolase